MKKLLAIILACTFVVAGCDKKDKGGGGTTKSKKVAKTPNDTRARCRDASYRDGYWYDTRDRRLDCSDYDRALDSDYLRGYDNDYCRSRRDTYMVYIGGNPRCATADYFYQLGYTGSLYQGNPYWIGYSAPYYAHQYWSHPSYYGYYGSGWYEYGDDDYSGGEVLAAGLIGLGTGIFLGTLL